VTDPSLFKAIVAIAPVTDLQQLKDDFRYFAAGGTSRIYRHRSSHPGRLAGAERVEHPRARACCSMANRDLNVRVIHSQNMTARSARPAARASSWSSRTSSTTRDSEARRACWTRSAPSWPAGWAEPGRASYACPSKNGRFLVMGPENRSGVRSGNGSDPP
jgi:hypothetical protein